MIMAEDATPSLLAPHYRAPGSPPAGHRPVRPAKTARAMPARTLFISGPDEDYRLGDPMLVHDLTLLLGTIEAPVASRDPSVVHLGRFLPTPAVRDAWQRQFAPLLLLEALLFVAQRMRDAATIHFTLAPPVEMRDGDEAGALTRLALLERAGATDLQLVPSLGSAILGSFVVQGRWDYSGLNLLALAAELFDQRSIYAQMRSSAPETGPMDVAGRWVGRQWDRVKP